MKGPLKRYHEGYLRTLIGEDLFLLKWYIFSGMKKAMGNKMLNVPENQNSSSEGLKISFCYSFILWLSHGGVPRERKAEEEERKVKNQDAVNLGLKEWQDPTRQRRRWLWPCVRCPLPRQQSQLSREHIYLLGFRAFCKNHFVRVGYDVAVYKLHIN